jgi:ParB-like chromosome segregation protein Spo0J
MKKKGDDRIRLLTSLNNHPRNPRDASGDLIALLRDSLAEYGDLSGVVLNVRTGHLVGGHQRLAAFNLAEVPAKVTHRLSKPDKTGTLAYGHIELNGTRYSYREVDWDERRALAANLAANKIAAEWKDQELLGILKELRDSPEAALPLPTGFDEAEFDKLMKKLSAPDSFPELDENLPIEHRCPKCGYQWSGKPKAGGE